MVLDPKGSVSRHRPRPPDRSGTVERVGVEIAFDVFEADRPTILLLPTWSIVDSRCWKLQVPYLARHFRVVTFDGRGSGRSGRPAGAAAYADREFARRHAGRPGRNRDPAGAARRVLLRRRVVGAGGGGAPRPGERSRRDRRLLRTVRAEPGEGEVRVRRAARHH
ncbi:hypothetical protein LP418_12365 [Nocardioides sp. B-3]|nr:hypothetical protein [Nocardioides sp. B-3]UUZ61306.1 hypothetical protein LP418_12365 [Nocardioides sp. B-3]